MALLHHKVSSGVCFWGRDGELIHRGRILAFEGSWRSGDVFGLVKLASGMVVVVQDETDRKLRVMKFGGDRGLLRSKTFYLRLGADSDCTRLFWQQDGETLHSYVELASGHKLFSRVSYRYR